MGYLEVYCQLCQVGFNLARYRTQHEPRDQGYGWRGDFYPGLEVKYWRRSDCIDEQGECSEDHILDPENEEHVAAPGQEFSGAYNGHDITKEEMEDIVHAVCLLSKKHAKDGAEATQAYLFEEDSRCFLTGIGQFPPSGMDLENIKPARYGLDECCINNWLSNVQDEDDPDPDVPWGIAMHQGCFDIFHLAWSKLYPDEPLNIDALFHLASIDDEDIVDYQGFKDVNYGDDVRDCQEQFWYHSKGTEYLAAHPFKATKLSANLCKALESSSPPVLLRLKVPHKSDPFSKFSQELIDMIIQLLPVRSVANMRLVSHAFGAIPDSFFRGLLKSGMPYLSISDEIKTKYQVEDIEDAIQAINESREKSHVPSAAKVDKLSWYHTYTILKADLLMNVKGLKNRKRIWESVNQIIVLMKKHSAEANRP